MSTAANNGSSRTAAMAKAALGAVSLLVLGGVLGVAVDRHLHASRTHALPDPDPRAAAAFHEMAMSTLEERLDLQPVQRAQIDSIIADHHTALQDAWRIVHTQLGATVDSVHNDIETVLTPVQRIEFREWLREADFGH